MRVVCDNCGASYKIPDSKLTKEVNKATCRKCGHAIFIRRAGEEGPRTVASQPAEQVEERTLITSAADLERAVRARAGSSFEENDQRPTTVSLDGGHGEATVPREPMPLPVAYPPPAHHPAASPSQPAPPLSSLAPPPPPPPFRSLPVSPTISPAISPTGEAARAVDPAAPAAQPRTDLVMALLALFATVLGVLILAVAAMLGKPIAAGLGVFLALLGILLVAFIVITGRMGARPANLILSFVGSFLLAAFAGSAATGGLYWLTPEVPVVTTPPPIGLPTVAPPVVPPVTPPSLADVAAPAATDPAATTLVPAEATPPVPATPAAATPAATTPTPAAATTPPATTPPATTPAATTPAATTPTTATSARTPTTSSRSTTTRTTAAVSKEPEEEPKTRITPSSTSTTKTSTTKTSTTKTEPVPAPAAKSSGVSTLVVDTMIKSNKAVKGCFISQRNETGELPKGVKVKMTIQPTGKVSSAAIPSGDWQGSAFDSCLSSAVKSIQFPPFEGDPVTLSYPFAI